MYLSYNKFTRLFIVKYIITIFNSFYEGLQKLKFDYPVSLNNLSIYRNQKFWWGLENLPSYPMGKSTN